MKIDRDKYEDIFLESVGAKREINKIENEISRGIKKESKEIEPNLSLDVDKSDREVVIHTQATGEVYNINWKVNVNPSDSNIKMKGVDLTTDQVIFEFPPGEYMIEAKVQYETNEKDHERTLSREISIS